MRAWVTIILVAISIGASVKVSRADRTYIGDGSNSCGAWTQERATDTQRVQLWKGWLLGFLSGANIWDSNADFLLTQKLDAAALYAWMDNYCRAHPLDTVYFAAIKLVVELQSRSTMETRPR
jgi:hypothetical protein